MILIVDDDPALREVLVELLTDEGYAVRTAVDGIEALELIERERPELVLSDVMMPRLDGYSLAARLVQAGIRVPVVLMSASVHESPLSTLRFVRKPFDVEHLLAVVAAALAEAAAVAA